MALSARNQLPGKITAVKNGIVTSNIQVDIGGHILTAVITKDSADEMGLKPGDEVKAVVKATSIMIMK